MPKCCCPNDYDLICPYRYCSLFCWWGSEQLGFLIRCHGGEVALMFLSTLFLFLGR